MKEIQTVAEHCKHDDCIYRRIIGTYMPVCYYAVVMGECRKCKISECDKYRSGTKKAEMKIEDIEWETIYDDDYI